MIKVNKIRTIIFGVLLLIAITSNAQQDKVTAAYEFLQQNEIDSAKANIDIAVLHPETASDPQAWYVHGFVYKTIFMKNEKNNKQSPARIVALNSFKKANSLNPDKEDYLENIENIKLLIGTLNNHASELLTPANYKIAIKLFNTFQEYNKLVDPSTQTFQSNQIAFDLALVAVYNSILEKAKTDSVKKQKFIALSKSIYNKVLKLDPENVSANYGMAILFYNQAVDLVLNTPLDEGLTTLNIMLDNSKELSKASLPFMQKAYELDPSRTATLEGLAGIYNILHEEEKSMEFRRKKAELEMNR